jgi:flagellar operon protein
MNPLSNPALVPPGGLSPAAVPPAAQLPGAGARERAQATPAKPFSDALREADGAVAAQGQQPLQFSRHALARVQRRGIELDQATLGRLSEGVGRAAGKGSRDSLVLVDGTAFVVSVSNRTVITAVGSEHMKDNVFTNIDSAVIA